MYGCHSGSTFRLVLVFFSVVLIVACDGASQDGDNNDNSDGGVVGNVGTGIVLSGSISIAPGSAIDSDVNDPDAVYESNNTLETAQTIGNPVTLGGYVNIAGSGEEGRSQLSGDENDYFVTQLFAGQSITINIADFNSPQPGSNSIGMFLLDADGNVVQHTTGQSQLDSINVNTTGIYYIRILALAGASNYVLTIGLSGNSVASNNADQNLDFVPGEVIVEFKQNVIQTSNTSSINSKVASLGLDVKAGVPSRAMLLSVSTGLRRDAALRTLGVKTVNRAQDDALNRKLETIEVASKLRERPEIKSARLNYYRQAAAIPNDEFYQFQWHYPQINLPEAWNVTTGDNNVIVAVIDTGVLLDHPDLVGQTVPGYDFIRDPQNAADGDGIDNNPYDVGDDANGNSSFHGTHVSGTVAAATDNNRGVAGIARDSRIMPIRVLGRFGGTDYDIEQGVRFAAGLPNDSGIVPAQKASVINLSLGGRTNSTVPPEAFRLARQAGVIIVAAAGNESSNTLSYPASLDGVVSVSAVAIDKTLAGYSNFGRTVDIAAPGGEFTDLNGDGFVDGVLSTAGFDTTGAIEFAYSFNQGTSMASPHVAGVAALMKAVYPELTPSDFDQVLEAGDITEDLGATGRDNNFGYGLINAYKAVTAASLLANEPVEPLTPSAEAIPGALNFGALTESFDFTISNAGEGDLAVLDISNDSDGWLTVSSLSVNAHGLGVYRALVNRDLLPPGTQTYSATINVSTSVNELNIPVIMQVFVNNVEDDAGLHYVLLKDAGTSATVKKMMVERVGGGYSFAFDGVFPGTYNIMSGTDSDNDGIVCEIAEACGVYYLPSQVIDIVVEQDSGNRGGINFETSFSNAINAQSQKRMLQPESNLIRILR